MPEDDISVQFTSTVLPAYVVKRGRDKDAEDPDALEILFLLSGDSARCTRCWLGLTASPTEPGELKRHAEDHHFTKEALWQ
jgi:hypothetical protein